MVERVARTSLIERVQRPAVLAPDQTFIAHVDSLETRVLFNAFADELIETDVFGWL